jgi:hypothetical protein
MATTLDHHPHRRGYLNGLKMILAQRGFHARHPNGSVDLIPLQPQHAKYVNEFIYTDLNDWTTIYLLTDEGIQISLIDQHGRLQDEWMKNYEIYNEATHRVN